jgi:hypothetical protein
VKLSVLLPKVQCVFSAGFALIVWIGGGGAGGAPCLVVTRIAH